MHAGTLKSTKNMHLPRCNGFSLQSENPLQLASVHAGHLKCTKRMHQPARSQNTDKCTNHVATNFRLEAKIRCGLLRA